MAGSRSRAPEVHVRKASPKELAEIRQFLKQHLTRDRKGEHVQGVRRSAEQVGKSMSIREALPLRSGQLLLWNIILFV